MKPPPLIVIGRARTPYAQKFGTPRQPGLAPHAEGFLEFFAPYGNPEAFCGLAGFSHVQVLFWFHKLPPFKGFRARVRPPRLGGNASVGVFASRSPFRPNPIGLSTLRLLAIEDHQGEVRLKVAGPDLVDGTPLLDIKPYVPFVDSVPEATGGYVDGPPRPCELRVSAPLKAWLLAHLGEERTRALCESLAQDPRPGYQNDPTREYFLPYARFDVGFTVHGDTLTVTRLKALND